MRRLDQVRRWTLRCLAAVLMAVGAVQLPTGEGVAPMLLMMGGVIWYTTTDF